MIINMMNPEKVTSPEQDDYLNEVDLPVLDPPPGFEDAGTPLKLEDHYYDDPYSDGEDRDCTIELKSQAIEKFADEMASSLLKAAIPRPKVKMRLRKSQPMPKQKCHFSESEVYSLPIDSLTDSDKKLGLLKNRHSTPALRPEPVEPVHMSLEEVRGYFREYHDSTSSSRRRPWMVVPSKSVESPCESKRKSCFVWTPHLVSKANSFDEARTKRSRKNLSVTAAGIKQALFNVFRISSHHPFQHHSESTRNEVCTTGWTFSLPDSKSEPQHLSAAESPRQHRALPPLPREDVGFVRVPPRSLPIRQYSVEGHVPQSQSELSETVLTSNVPRSFVENIETHSERYDVAPNHSKQDFAASIEAVKDYGWYWGPLSGEAAEQILANEPDGSFLVRDSSDDHYIFSLSFKLNGGVRHVRIEHDHGNFSFGSVARFRSQTMVEFIDKAIEHSRSGRFLFFLHRRPTHGPTRVQLLHPVSRFRNVQSLQHLSRFVILKLIRRDQINLLPLPRRLRDYLNTAHYYSEQLQGSLCHSP